MVSKNQAEADRFKKVIQNDLLGDTTGVFRASISIILILLSLIILFEILINLDLKYSY